jgi:hypothetical protein
VLRGAARGCVHLESSASLEGSYPEARVLDRDAELTVLREQNLFLLFWDGDYSPRSLVIRGVSDLLEAYLKDSR